MSKASSFILVFLLLILSIISYSCAPKPKQVDVLITGALVFTGENKEAEQLSVAITGDQITFVGRAEESEFQASQVIDAEGLHLAPGMIDPHTHLATDLSDPDGKKNLAFLRQGVTTVFTGNDGSSPMPTGSKLAEWESNGIGTNAGLFVGHGSVRSAVLGLENVQPDDATLKEMKAMVQKAMDDGAFGMSSGLFYAPASFAQIEEVIALSEVVYQNGGIYDTHIRDESSYSIGLIEAIREVFTIGKETGIPVHISHIKALGADVWGKSKEVISMIEEAQQQGIKVTANQYPYLASRTSLKAAVVPRWAEAGGNEAMIKRFVDPKLHAKLLAEITENIRKRGGPETLMFSDAKNKSFNGLYLKEYAEKLSLSYPEAAIKMLSSDPGIKVISFNMREEDLESFMQQPWVMTGSDGGSGHPRKYGSFAKKLAQYAMKDSVISLAFAIHTSSGLTAETLGIHNRGYIREGYYADMFLFDPKKYADKATFDQPFLEAVGVEYVWVNGQLAIEEGLFTGKLAGKALRKNKQE